MSATVEFLKVNAKAVVGFVAGLVINAIQAVVNGEVPWPQSLKEWGQYLGTALIAGVLVWVTGNKLTGPQIVKGAVQQGITVVTKEALEATENAIQRGIREATDAIPSTISDRVDVLRIGQDVATKAGDVLKSVASNFPGFPKEFL